MQVTDAAQKGYRIVLLALAALVIAAFPSAAAAAAPTCSTVELSKTRDTANPSYSGAIDCTDADGDDLDYTFPDGPAGRSGSFEVAGDTVTYTPDEADFAGFDFVTIEASDGTNTAVFDFYITIYRSHLDTTATGPTTVTAGTNATYTLTSMSSADSQESELVDAFIQTSANSLDGVGWVGSSESSCDPGGSASLYVDCPEFTTLAPGGQAQVTATFSFGPAAIGKTFIFTFATTSPLATHSFQDLTIHVVAPSGGGGGGSGGGAGGGGEGGGGGTGGGGADTTPPAPTAIKGASSIASATLIKSGYANQILGLTPGDKVTERLQISGPAARAFRAAAKPVVIGSGKAVANSKGTASVRVKLTRKAKAALRKAKAKSLKASLVIRITDAAGNSTVRKKTVTIKLKR